MFFFFFKQKTAYEMRISDWSSDVCSSDLMHVPTALSQPRDTAAAVVRALEKQAGSGARKPALAVWMGGDAQATSTLNAAGVPTYASEAEAVRGFMYLVRHREEIGRAHV